MNIVQTQNHLELLEDGSAFIDYGPVSMVLGAYDGVHALTELYYGAFAEITRILRDIAGDLPLLRHPASPDMIPLVSSPSRLMVRSALDCRDSLLTPLACVAGAVSQLTADYLFTHGASKVYVNNGGDIALRMAPGNSLCVGLMAGIDDRSPAVKLVLEEGDGIGGIATSGLGGRSFTLGIARSVTVMASCAGLADGLATHLANSTSIHSPSVKRRKAGDIQPDCDIPNLDVVTEVGDLSAGETARAGGQFIARAGTLSRYIEPFSAVAFIGDHSFTYNCGHLNFLPFTS